MSTKKNISQPLGQLQMKFENTDSKMTTKINAEVKVVKLNSVNVKSHVRDFSRSVILNSKSF